MLMSSMMGAIAFQKDLGAVHSCAHALSTVADLHHGLANGIMIDHVMRFNAAGGDGEDGRARARRRRCRRRRHGRCSRGGRVHRLARADEGGARHPGDARRDRGARPVTRPTSLRWSTSRSTTPATRPTRGRARARTSSGIFAAGDVSGTRRTATMLKIGISACFFHEDPKRPIFKGMTLQYIEQNVAHWLMQRDVLAFMVPSPEGRTRRAGSKATVEAYARRARRPGADGRLRRLPRVLRREGAASPSGTATASATTTRSALLRAFMARGQAGAGRLPRRAGDQRRAGRHALPGHRDAGCRTRSTTATGRSTQRQLPRDVARARQRARRGSIRARRWSRPTRSTTRR